MKSSALSLMGTETRHSFRCWLRGIKHRLLPCRDRSLLGKMESNLNDVYNYACLQGYVISANPLRILKT